MAKKPTPPTGPDEPPKFDAATEAELDAAADITPADIAGAQTAWRLDAPKPFRDLLDATPDEEQL